MTRPLGTGRTGSGRPRAVSRRQPTKTIDHTSDRIDVQQVDQVPARPRSKDIPDTARPPARSTDEPSVALEAIARALISLLVPPEPEPRQPEHHAHDTPLLDVDETAELLRVSRMTVTRLVDEGQLPSVTIRKGKTHKLRRIPRAFIERLVADANAGTQVDMEAYAAAWLAEQAQQHELRKDLRRPE